jgi:lipopolysaccharide transport system ATP-binding protein
VAPLHIEIEYQAPSAIPSPIFGVTVSREDGAVCYYTSTRGAGQMLPAMYGTGCICCQS